MPTEKEATKGILTVILFPRGQLLSLTRQRHIPRLHELDPLEQRPLHGGKGRLPNAFRVFVPKILLNLLAMGPHFGDRRAGNAEVSRRFGLCVAALDER